MTMATWVVHMRIADRLIKQGAVPDKFKREFVLGSVSPDCGYGKKDSFGDFSPPPSVTHWTPYGIKVFCKYDDFFDTYLKNKKKNDDYYFYFGYYVHLLTDVLWSASIYLPTKIKYAEEYKKDNEYLNVIKKDWYDLDFKYLKEHPDFEPYEILKNNNSVKDYLPYYEKGQLTIQTRFIADYYKDEKNHNTDRQFKFLTEKDVNEFIKIAEKLIKCKINQ